MTVPSQQTFSGSPRAADDHGIHVTSHSPQVIRLPTPGTPRLPQFQHSLGSAICWLPLICFPPQLFRMTGICGPVACVYLAEPGPAAVDTSVRQRGPDGRASSPRYPAAYPTARLAVVAEHREEAAMLDLPDRLALLGLEHVFGPAGCPVARQG